MKCNVIRDIGATNPRIPQAPSSLLAIEFTVHICILKVLHSGKNYINPHTAELMNSIYEDVNILAQQACFFSLCF
jgi:hypothetical protein